MWNKIVQIATGVFTLLQNGSLPTNLFNLVQAAFTVIQLGEEYLPQLEAQIETILDAIGTLLRGDVLSDAQIAKIDADFESVNQMAAQAEDQTEAEAEAAGVKTTT